MIEEFWGTLSLYDHRSPMFVKSLILFDRIVIPIPDNAIYDITDKEIEMIRADADFLKANNAAIICDWNTEEFARWGTEYFKEALTVRSTDKLYDSRLMMIAKAVELKPSDVYDFTAVPVYGARKEFSDAYNNLITVRQESLMIEMSQLISVPDINTPLEEVIKLRNQPSFESARRALRDWQIKKMPEILGERSEKNILLASEDLKRMLSRYEEEINKGNFKKEKIVVTSLLSLGAVFAAAMGHTQAAIGLIAGAAPNLFALKESIIPAWKDIRDKPFEAAGVIYEANKLFM